MKLTDKKIVLIVPKSLHSWESLACGYLASYSYKFGFKPEQYRFYLGSFDSDNEILKGCENADVIGFSLTTFQIDHALSLIVKIKQFNIKAKVVWGGYAVNGFDGKQLIGMYGRYVDYFVQGPGEESWLEVITENAKSRVLRKPMLTNLDLIPFPDRDFIRIDRHFDKLFKLGEGRKTSMEMQRTGCPYKCSFCAANSFSKNRGKRSAENIIEEMKLLSDRYEMDKNSMVLMSDAEIFMTSEMKRMAEMKIDQNIDFKYGMNVVASTIIEKEQRNVLRRMVDSGCSEVWMGVESDPSLMHLTGKPNTPDQVKEAFKITKDMGLIRKAYFILAFTPEETEETILNRIPFIEELEPDVVGFTLYIPVPGSSGYNHELHKNIDYSKSCEYFNDYITTDTLSNQRLKELQEKLTSHFNRKLTFRQKFNPQV